MFKFKFAICHSIMIISVFNIFPIMQINLFEPC